MILGDSTYVHLILDKISDQAKHQPYSVTLHPHVEVWENVKIYKNPFEASDSEKIKCFLRKMHIFGFIFISLATINSVPRKSHCVEEGPMV